MTSPNDLRSRSLQLRTGVTLRCTERPGDGGETLLLLHGYSDSGLSFVPVLRALPQDWRLLAPDQRGHGDSERPLDGYAIADLAADAAALLDAAGVGAATVVGHSMGSLVAQQLALDHPERVARLVLVGGGAHGATGEVEKMARDVAALVDPVPDAFVREFQLGTLAREIPAAFLEEAIAESRKLPARVWRALYAGIVGFDVRERLGRIACPTLLVWGSCDGIFGRAEQERLLLGIRGAALYVYEGAGHALHWEQPERFARDLREFVAAREPAQPPIVSLRLPPSH
jgi:pimeloyl-ACP methyl ester carboxylesterase